MKVFACVITYGNEPYLQYALSSVYPAVDGIIVIEGYCQEYSHLNLGSRYTTDIIKRIDRDGKIVYRNIGNVNSKNDCRNAYLQEMWGLASEGDWMVQLDADEGWFPEDLLGLKKQPSDVWWIGVPFDDFIGDFRHVYVHSSTWYENAERNEAKYYDKNGNWMVNDMYQERVVRWMKGMNYTHNHTAIRDGAGCYLYADGNYSKHRLLLPLNSETRWKHYGWVGRIDWIYHKCLYYYTWRDEKALSGSAAKEAVQLDDRYWYISTGGEELLDKSRFVIYPTLAKHPHPYSEHPWLEGTREEIIAWAM